MLCGALKFTGYRVACLTRHVSATIVFIDKHAKCPINMDPYETNNLFYTNVYLVQIMVHFMSDVFLVENFHIAFAI